MPISLKTLKTSTFRLAAIYMMVFALSVGVILGYVYLNTVVLLQQQTDDTIGAEVQGLAEQYRQRGLSGMLEIIKERSNSNTGSVYLFTNFVGRRLAGNLDGTPTRAIRGKGWIEFPYAVRTQNGIETHVARAFHLGLEGGYNLVVGRDIEERLKFTILIRRALFWALGLAVFFGIGGALLMSRNFLKRIDSISDTTRRIMAGDLTERMPVSGTGDELDRLAVSLNEMLAQIEQLMNAMKEVSSNVAHDLRTPLNRVRARVEAALRSSDPKEQREALEKTLIDADQLLATFNALLSIAKAESGEARNSFTDVDLGQLVEDMAELYEPIIEDRNGTIEVTAPHGIIIPADRHLLAQVLTNLLDNALKYGASEADGRPHIELAVEETASAIRIIIADSGKGIAASDYKRVTKRFVRLEASRSEPGNGLGLSLAKGVMKLHSGRLIFTDNAPGLKIILEFSRK